MKRFFIKLALFSLVVLASFCYLLAPKNVGFIDPYLNYSASGAYETFDGIHLEGADCLGFSRQLGLDILKTAGR